MSPSRLFYLSIIVNGFLKVSRNIDLVYGGGSIGLMGLVSQAVHEGGRHVIGYITLSLFTLLLLLSAFLM